ncbi:kinesin family member C2/C3 [Nematocida sp. LUAm3]|nr:kinesin family member C2/C3 [Nematocida sp. LUAm3]KAI5174556.1 kinesin family member C2/C3 [Nematocida sp. LUAm2]KAI5178038.1 kinesin family member C2/C3 [Nematocida sp. LUAm1]
MDAANTFSVLLEKMASDVKRVKMALRKKERTTEEILMRDSLDKDSYISSLQEEVWILRERCMELEHLRQQEALFRTKTSSVTEIDHKTVSVTEVEDTPLIERLNNEVSSANSKILEQSNIFRVYKEKTEKRIRDLLEELLQLKGQIRAICRVKPFSCSEPVEIEEETLTLPKRGPPYHFTSVSGPSSDQNDLFKKLEDLMYSVCKGHRVGLLAYGATGSGKSYTVEGTETHPGVLFRALNYIEDELRKKETGWVTKVICSSQEIYNDKVIEERKETVNTPKEALPLFISSFSSRRTGSTECNKRSSRSHLILRISVEMKRPVGQTEESLTGELCVVDLAGSERLSHSKAEGTRMKETQEINKSLSALADVIHAIHKKAPHIPYRNSKLTWALKSVLGEGARTAFIINVDPQASIEETISTLNFSRIIQKCYLNNARNTLYGA